MLIAFLFFYTTTIIFYTQRHNNLRFSCWLMGPLLIVMNCKYTFTKTYIFIKKQLIRSKSLSNEMLSITIITSSNQVLMFIYMGSFGENLILSSKLLCLSYNCNIKCQTNQKVLI